MTHEVPSFFDKKHKNIFLSLSIVSSITKDKFLQILSIYLLNYLMALTQYRAEERSKIIRKGTISYDLHICLQKGATYSGYVEINFMINNVPTQLALDFKGKQVNRLVQNKESIEVQHHQGFIFLDITKLTAGFNTVGIHYNNKYDNDGSGCVSFIDTDQKQYVSTQFSPYFANRVFPCFDQPDLKATMKLFIICPSDWKKVISNQSPIEQKEMSAFQYKKWSNTYFPQEIDSYIERKSGKMFIFPPTKPLPTYLFCFIAGDYKNYSLPNEKQSKNIPITLYCTEQSEGNMISLAPFFFEIILESMKFYQTFFNYPYSFSKFDMIEAHQYKWGAMENAGAVVFRDIFHFDKNASSEQLLIFAVLISHQLSHHWFGNLVTMQWWDDLWLNEAFATFISYFCLQKIKSKLTTATFESPMTAFYQNKRRGYSDDILSTTHPIRSKVQSTSVADSIFDGITYQKGAAVMKQFCFLMGEDNFSKGLSDYFHKYQWKNATINDFLGQMNNYYNIPNFDLNSWKKMWLQQASFNILEAKWSQQSTSNSSSLVIHQSPCNLTHLQLRLHKIKIGLFFQDGSMDVVQALVLPQRSTVVQYDQEKKYKAVLLNFEDHTFAKNKIDPISLEFFSQNLMLIKDILSRQVIWNTFFEMIYQAKMLSHKYVEIVVNSIANQPSDSIFKRVFNDLYMAVNIFTPIKFRKQLNSTIFEFLLNLLVTSSQQNKRVATMKSNLVKFASTEEEILLLLRWKNRKQQKLQHLFMTCGQQWEVVKKIFTLKSLTLEQKQNIFKLQTKIDPINARNYKLICDSLKSNQEEFQQIYENLKTSNGNSVEAKKNIAEGWNHLYHQQRLLKYRERFFEDLQKLSETVTGDHLTVFYEQLAPIDDDLEYHLASFEKIKVPKGKEKHEKDIYKEKNFLKGRILAYQLYKNL